MSIFSFSRLPNRELTRLPAVRKMYRKHRFLTLEANEPGNMFQKSLDILSSDTLATISRRYPVAMHSERDESVHREICDEDESVSEIPGLIRAIITGDMHMFASTLGIGSSQLTAMHFTQTHEKRKASSLSESVLHQVLHTTFNSHSPLVYAVRYDRTHMLSWLIALGADPNQLLSYGENVLMRLIAMSSRPDSMACDVDHHTYTDNSSSLPAQQHLTSQSRSRSNMPSNALTPAPALSDPSDSTLCRPQYSGLSLAEVTRQWLLAQTPPPSLAPALSAGGGISLALVKTLVAAGLDLHAKNAQGRNLVHYAVDRRMCELITYLSAAGCDINLRDKDDCSPLMLAVAKGYADVVAVLLHAGADAMCVSAVQDMSAAELSVAAWLRHAREEFEANELVNEQDMRRKHQDNHSPSESTPHSAAPSLATPAAINSVASASSPTLTHVPSRAAPRRHRARSLVGLYGCQSPGHALAARQARLHGRVFEGAVRPGEPKAVWPAVPYW